MSYTSNHSGAQIDAGINKIEELSTFDTTADGLVPAPESSETDKVLHGDGDWGGVSTDILEQGVDALILDGGSSGVTA